MLRFIIIIIIITWGAGRRLLSLHARVGGGRKSEGGGEGEGGEGDGGEGEGMIWN